MTLLAGDLTTLTDGTISVSATQTDLADNTSPAGTTSFVLDTQAPAAPTETLAADTGSSGSDGITSNATVNVGGLESGATWQYQVDGGSFTAGTGTSFSLTSGSHTYAVRQTDVAGNLGPASGTSTFVLDTTNPAAPTETLAADTGSSGSDGITSNATVNVGGLESGATWQFQVDGGSFTAGTGTSFSLTSGSHTYAVRQTDVAGNLGPASGTSTFVLDTTNPAAPTETLAADTGSSGSDGITSNATVNVGGLESGATWQYQVDGGSFTTGTGTSFSLTSGSHTYAVRQTDVAGNLGPASGTSTFVLDQTAPAAPTETLAADTGSSGSDGITSNATVNVGGLESGATWQYQVDGGSFTTGTGTSFSLTSGSHTYAVRQTDVAGNLGPASGTSTFVLDTTNPAAPTETLAADTGSNGSDGITSNATVNVGGLESGATWQYQVDGGSFTAGTGTSFSLTSGSHTYAVRQTDVAGNLGPASGTSTFVLDTTNPAAPTETLAADTGSSGSDGITSNATVNVGGLESGATWQYQVDGGSFTTGTGTSFSLTSGSHTYAVRQTDVAGNLGPASGTSTFVLDQAAPAAPSAPDLLAASDSGSSSTDNITNIAAGTYTGTAEAGSTVTIYDTNGTTVLGTGTATGGNYSIVTSALTSGAHTLTAKATDAAGNVSVASGSLAVTIDTTAPAAPTETLAADTGSSGSDGITSNATVNVGLESGATWQYQVDGGSFTTGTGTSFSLTSGSHTYAVRQTDVAGNLGPASGTSTFVLDQAAPAAPSAPDLAAASDSGSSSTDNITNIAAGTYTGTAEAGSTVTIYDTDGMTVLGTGTATGGNYSIVTSALTSGAHTLTAKATDAAGNVSVASGSLAVTIDTTADAAPALALSAVSSTVKWQ